MLCRRPQAEEARALIAGDMSPGARIVTAMACRASGLTLREPMDNNPASVWVQAPRGWPRPLPIVLPPTAAGVHFLDQTGPTAHPITDRIPASPPPSPSYPRSKAMQDGLAAIEALPHCDEHTCVEHILLTAE